MTDSGRASVSVRAASLADLRNLLAATKDKELINEEQYFKTKY